MVSPGSWNTLTLLRLLESPDNLSDTYAHTNEATEYAEHRQKVVDPEPELGYLLFVERIVHEDGHYEGEGGAGEGTRQVDEQAEFGHDHC